MHSNDSVIPGIIATYLDQTHKSRRVMNHIYFNYPFTAHKTLNSPHSTPKLASKRAIAACAQKTDEIILGKWLDNRNVLRYPPWWMGFCGGCY